MKDRRLSEPAE